MDDAGIYVEALPHVIELRAKVESLQAQLAAAREAVAGAFMQGRAEADRLVADLAAVRTDLSVARAEIEAIKNDLEWKQGEVDVLLPNLQRTRAALQEIVGMDDTEVRTQARARARSGLTATPPVAQLPQADT